MSGGGFLPDIHAVLKWTLHLLLWTLSSRESGITLARVKSVMVYHFRLISSELRVLFLSRIGTMLGKVDRGRSNSHLMSLVGSFGICCLCVPSLLGFLSVPLLCSCISYPRGAYRMGMCAIQGPRVLHDEPEDEELSPRSTISSSSSASIGGSTSLRELHSVEAPVWQRTIPKGRRCKPLSFSGMILYDESGKQVELSLEELEDDEDEEYFSSQRNLAEREAEFHTPTVE